MSPGLSPYPIGLCCLFWATISHFPKCTYILSQTCLSNSLRTNKVFFFPTPGHSLPPLVLAPPWEALRHWLGPGDLCRNSSINAQTMAQEAPAFNVPEGLHSCSKSLSPRLWLQSPLLHHLTVVAPGPWAWVNQYDHFFFHVWRQRCEKTQRLCAGVSLRWWQLEILDS